MRMILEEKYMLLEYLRNKFENDKIEITTKIIEGEKNNIPYTNKDKFKLHAHQDAIWAPLQELSKFNWAAADIPIVKYLQN